MTQLWIRPVGDETARGSQRAAAIGTGAILNAKLYQARRKETRTRIREMLDASRKEARGLKLSREELALPGRLTSLRVLPK